jgi:ABC-2 type transport system permease protein
MSLRRAFTIAQANLVRLFRDRLGLFFIVVLPIMLIFVLGLQFGGGFEARIALVAPRAGDLGDAFARALDERWQVERHADVASARESVASGRVELGVVLPDGYGERLEAGETVVVELLADSGAASVGRRRIVEAIAADQAAAVRAARFVAAERGGRAADHRPAVERVRAQLPPLGLNVVTVGESLFPAALRGFALGAQSQLILFVFLTSLTGAAQLILSRQLGVSRRMLSTPTSTATILLGEGLGRFAVAIFQALLIVGATALLFDVAWGDALAAAAIILAFSLVGAAVAMLIGAVANNAEQAASVGVMAGLGVAAIGGCMVPPEIFPEPMATISWLTPHRWALDALRELIGGAGLVDVLPQLGLLAGAAVAVFALATWRLRRALTG